ncbi:MAG: T9SS type A sorting domain-containing protein, partial [Bacteroidota bacterium]
ASFNGLENLTSVGGGVTLDYNHDITSLTGLENLASIGGWLGIGYNMHLSSLTGLENLATLGGGLSVANNDILTSLLALQSIESASINNLMIVNNPSLSRCEAQGICDYLANSAATSTIYGNAPGCSNRDEVELACDSSFYCLPDGIVFTTQSQVDSFQINHPGCSGVEGDVKIFLSNISNLNGLSVLTSIGRDLIITDNLNLSSLNGLQNLHSIGRDLIVGNNSLVTLSGLNDLNHIGSNVQAGNFLVENNPFLINFTGLENLTQISGKLDIVSNPLLINLQGLNSLSYLDSDLTIDGNQSLESLSGIDGLTFVTGSVSISNNSSLANIAGIANILPQSVSYLDISHNPLLSVCEVHSVCDYIANSYGIAEITDNAEGCDSLVQVQRACLFLDLKREKAENEVQILPNPSSGIFNFKITLKEHTDIILSVFNSMGKLVENVMNEQFLSGTHYQVWDASGLPSGVYFARIIAGNQVIICKMVKNE